MKRKPKVAIIGGGIGGMAAALACQRRGLDVAVYERSPALVEVGAGLNLSPNALKALRYLGVEKAAIAIGFQDTFQNIRNFRSGRIIVRNDRGGPDGTRFGAGFLTIHRADLLATIAGATSSDVVRLGYACTGVRQHGTICAASFENGNEIEADIIVGADGIHSAVRASLFGPDTPRFTGCVCWRGMVPVEALDGTLIRNEMTSWWGPHGHVVNYRVRRGELMNFVAHYDSDAWRDESWTRECDPRELKETYAEWHPLVHRLFAASERSYKWALFDRDPLKEWGRGGITLLGDAAHPMLPYLGQGAGMTLEDACILADRIAMRDWPESLRAYERLRMPRTARAQLGSRERAKENHLPSTWARLKRDVTLAFRNRFAKDRSSNRGAWLYEVDPSQSR
jgi:salicylate hydroxylase